MITGRNLSFRSLRASIALVICLTAMLVIDGGRSVASAQQKTSPELIERARLDWSHSGELTTFSLFRQHDANGEATDRLIIGVSGGKSWNLTSHDGEWVSMSEAGLSQLNRQNLVSTSKHFLFVSSGSPDASIYLILKGVDYGCCVGSLTVVTPDDHGQPRIVFQASSHLLAAVNPTEDGNGLEMVGQSSDSEARALKNAQSYDPYRVYLLDHDRPARYDLALSKAYTLAHYCQWHGPKYDEKVVAVGPTTGSAHCRVMAEPEFDAYRQKHPQLFPEP